MVRRADGVQQVVQSGVQVGGGEALQGSGERLLGLAVGLGGVQLAQPRLLRRVGRRVGQHRRARLAELSGARAGEGEGVAVRGCRVGDCAPPQRGRPFVIRPRGIGGVLPEPFGDAAAGGGQAV